jgi:hypothetical protein
VIARWRRLAAEALDRRFGPLNARLDRSDARIAEIEAVLGRQSAVLDRQSADLERALALLRSLAADDPGNRRRLAAARAGADYSAPWEEDDPLVSVIIPTRDRPRLLLERSLPSVLAQTHENLEVLVMGDAAGPEVAEAVESVADPRVRFVNMTHRYERPDGDTWLTAGTLTRNEGYRLARGLWLAEADDDDALRPDAIAALIAHARRHRLEVAYGLMVQHLPDGSTSEIGSFPPRLGDSGWQGAIVHGALRFFAREHIAADLGLPGDWFRTERMLRAGVRFGRLEQVTSDYYPAKAWRPD